MIKASGVVCKIQQQLKGEIRYRIFMIKANHNNIEHGKLSRVDEYRLQRKGKKKEKEYEEMMGMKA